MDLNLLIVDDEPIIRAGMRRGVDWKSIGISEVFTAGSGTEALEIMEKKDIFTVITDIRMNGMSGIELTEKIRKQNPDIRVVVMSAYDEFEYAQKSLRLKVDDFLVKPVDEDLLTELVGRFVKEKKEEQERLQMNSLRRRVLGTNETQKLGHVMRKLLNGEADSGQMIQELQEIYCYPEKQRMCAVVFYSRTEKADDEYESYAWMEFCTSNIDLCERGITFRDAQGRLVIVFFCPGKKSGERIQQVEEFINLFNSEFHVSQKVAVGSVVEGFSQIALSYHEALLLMEETVDEGIDILESDQIRKQNVLFRDVLAEIKNRILQEAGDAQSVYRAFRIVSRMTETYDLSLQAVRRSCFEFAMTVYYGQLSNCRNEKNGNVQEYTEALLSSGRQGALEVTKAFLDYIYNIQEAEVHATVEKSKIYIQEHLAEKLSVSSIAQMYYVAPAYFSRLFKKVQGEGCSEYITRVRMEKASYLLRSTALKTGEIAFQTGYTDKNYFSLTFKKFTGMSPTVYRAQFLDEG